MPAIEIPVAWNGIPQTALSRSENRAMPTTVA
jgi:hypothetical protein